MTIVTTLARRARTIVTYSSASLPAVNGNDWIVTTIPTNLGRTLLARLYREMDLPSMLANVLKENMLVSRGQTANLRNRTINVFAPKLILRIRQPLGRT